MMWRTIVGLADIAHHVNGTSSNSRNEGFKMRVNDVAGYGPRPWQMLLEP